MKQTKIIFIELPGDKIKIIDFENIARGIDIRTEFGLSIMHAYSKAYPHYNYSSFLKGIIIYLNKERSILIKRGQILKKEIFTKIISLLKQSGINLRISIEDEKEKQKNVQAIGRTLRNCRCHIKPIEVIKPKTIKI